jgi:type IV pilus assembly protein PilC
MKKAKEFAQKTAGEIFNLGEEKISPEELKLREQEKIVLDIGRSKKKIRLKKHKAVEETGNFFIDTYRKLNEALINLGKIKLQEKAIFFRLLAVMVEAGIPIIRSLHTLSDQNKKNPKFAKIISDMAFKIEAGESLSGAMERYNKVFSESEIGMVRSGEVSGHLNDILKDLARETEKNASTVSKVKGALTYPAVVMSILFIVLFLMMTMVIPKLTKLFTQTGSELPKITQIVINTSSFLRDNALFILSGVIGFFVLFFLWIRTKQGRYAWHYILLRIPIIGSLVQKSTLAQVSRTLGNLLASGVSIVQSINIVSNATKNEVYKRKIKFAGDDIRGGIPLAESLRSSNYFPLMFVNMIEIGEQTAQLEMVCKKIAAFYDEQVDESVKNLTKIIEPIIMVFVGITVGGLVAAIMLPIMSLANIAGNV